VTGRFAALAGTVAVLLATMGASTPTGARLLFGMGPEADGALATPLVRSGSVGMLTSWFNQPSDLAWMGSWQRDLVPQAYARGLALHVVVYGFGPYQEIDTPSGRACGSPYPLSPGFLDDQRRLARIFAGTPGSPPVYVTMFTEFQTYPCRHGAWAPDPETTAYYTELKKVYLEALAVWHAEAPNSRVSLGWGGWQARWDDPPLGGGRSMIGHFADVLRASDFQSVQAMQSDTNVADVRDMTRLLGAYGPVMLAHYKPDNADQRVFDADVRSLLADDTLAELTGDGLFAFSFMDEVLVDSSAQRTFVEHQIRRHGREDSP